MNLPTHKASSSPVRASRAALPWRGSIPLAHPTHNIAGQFAGVDPCDKHRYDDSRQKPYRSKMPLISLMFVRARKIFSLMIDR